MYSLETPRSYGEYMQSLTIFKKKKRSSESENKKSIISLSRADVRGYLNMLVDHYKFNAEGPKT